MMWSSFGQYVYDNALAFENFRQRRSMTRLDDKFNGWLGDEGKAVLRKAIEGRSGFELVL